MRVNVFFQSFYMFVFVYPISCILIVCSSISFPKDYSYIKFLLPKRKKILHARKASECLSSLKLRTQFRWDCRGHKFLNLLAFDRSYGRFQHYASMLRSIKKMCNLMLGVVVGCYTPLNCLNVPCDSLGWFTLFI